MAYERLHNMNTLNLPEVLVRHYCRFRGGRQLLLLARAGHRRAFLGPHSTSSTPRIRSDGMVMPFFTMHPRRTATPYEYRTATQLCSPCAT